MIQLKDFHLLKPLVFFKSHLTDNVGILKFLKIEYNENIDLALCTPTTQYILLLANTCPPFELILLFLNKGANKKILL